MKVTERITDRERVEEREREREKEREREIACKMALAADGGTGKEITGEVC